MKSLVIDTSSEIALLAVIENEKILFQKFLPGGPELSKNFALEVKNIVDKFDRIVIGIGPGSFTGVRVGAAMAQALSMGWNIPLFSASSLNAFAPENPDFAVAVDARSGGIFVQKNFENPQLLPLEEATKILPLYPIIASPHPEKIQSRITDSLPLAQAHPNPLLLSRFSTETPIPALFYT